MNAYVRIIKANIDYDKKYTYIVPESIAHCAHVGVFVNVPLGSRTELGIIVGFEPENAPESPYRLKRIIGMSDAYRPLTEKQLRLAELMTERYVCSFVEAVRTIATPKTSIKQTLVRLAVSEDEALALTEDSKIKSIGQINIIKYLLKEKKSEKKELLMVCDCTAATLGSLKKKNIIEVYEEDAEPGEDSLRSESCSLEMPKNFNDEQRSAFRLLDGLRQKKVFSEALIYGITGSGKTEIYLQLIDKALSEGQGAILLVPEIVLTEQMIKRVISRFGSNAAVLHSRLTDRERAAEMAKLESGRVRLAVGVRSCVFAPVKNLKLIICDEEQEPSYKSFETRPYYNAGDVAAMRMRLEEGLVVYGSATPRVTTFFRAVKGEIALARLTKRATDSSLPEVTFVDMKEELKAGFRSPVSRTLAGELKKNLEKGEQSIIFLPRRGYSAKLVCLNCGKTIGCRRCRVPMSYHKNADRIICHYCGMTERTPRECPYCGDRNISPRTYGTEMAEEELKRLFPTTEIVRMDTDSTRLKNGHKKLLERFEKENVPFLVGTQMVAKGLDFANVTLVGVISADSILNLSEYNARERTFVLLTQVFGRAGRSEKAGRAVLQTMTPDSEVYKYAAAQDYNAFYESEIDYRKISGYPPFKAVCTFSVSHTDDRTAYNAAAELKALFEKSEPEIETLSVIRCAIPKINDRYRWNFVAKDESLERLLSAVGKFYRKLSRPVCEKYKDLRFSVDVEC